MAEYNEDNRVDMPDGQPIDDQPRWRKDFPIDWPEDHYVARRDFTKFMVLTSFAFVVGQFWIGAQNAARARRGAPPIMRIAHVDQIPVGSAMAFTYPGKHNPCLLLRTGEQHFLAYSNQCSHLLCPVVPQFDKGLLKCPCHSGYFDLESGRPVAGPPRRPLPRITLEIRDGYLYATGVELRMT
jgi:Rieske Fe-S protein